MAVAPVVPAVPGAAAVRVVQPAWLLPVQQDRGVVVVAREVRPRRLQVDVPVLPAHQVLPRAWLAAPRAAAATLRLLAVALLPRGRSLAAPAVLLRVRLARLALPLLSGH